jgi:hypothetical protein
VYDPLPSGKVVCKICNVVIFGEKNCIQHDKGKKHVFGMWKMMEKKKK